MRLPIVLVLALNGPPVLHAPGLRLLLLQLSQPYFAAWRPWRNTNNHEGEGGFLLLAEELKLIDHVLIDNHASLREDFIGGDVVGNIIGVVTQLGSAGLAGLIALVVVFWLFRHQSRFDDAV